MSINAEQTITGSLKLWSTFTREGLRYLLEQTDTGWRLSREVWRDGEFQQEETLCRYDWQATDLALAEFNIWNRTP